MNAVADDDIYVQKTSTGDVYIFDPFNDKNIEITREDVETILARYGVKGPIHNLKYYQRAFVHQSYTRRPHFENTANNITIVPCPAGCLPLYSKSNERLEYIGDGVLENITKYYLYCRFPKQEPGFLTDKKIALVKNESIGKIAYEMGLHKWLVLSKHAELKKTRTNLKKLGCLFEAFIGAIFHDFNKVQVQDTNGGFHTGVGFQTAQVFVQNVYENHVNWPELILNDDNYKNILQVKIQKEFKTTPHYIELPNGTTVGDDVKYKMGVFLCLGQDAHGLTQENSVSLAEAGVQSFQDIHQWTAAHQGQLFLFLGEGQHALKKKAEQLACQNALTALQTF
jgi:ribonuclease-3